MHKVVALLIAFGMISALPLDAPASSACPHAEVAGCCGDVDAGPHCKTQCPGGSTISAQAARGAAMVPQAAAIGFEAPRAPAGARAPDTAPPKTSS